MTTISGLRRLDRSRPARTGRSPSIVFAAAVLGAQAFVPVARAQDVTPPDIAHDPVREVPAGGATRLEATVVDDGTGVANVTLNLGLGDGGFEALGLKSDDGELFTGTLSAETLVEGDSLRYYLTATDGAGNEQSRGFAFDPLVVRVGPPAAAPAPVAETGSSRTAWYVVGGAIALGLVAVLAGGGSDGGDGAAAEPPGPTLGQDIFVQ